MIPYDKLLHLNGGAVAAALAFTVSAGFLPLVWSCVIAFVFALLVLIGKEVYDKLHPVEHYVELADILYGLLGAVLIIGYSVSLFYIFKS